MEQSNLLEAYFSRFKVFCVILLYKFIFMFSKIFAKPFSLFFSGEFLFANLIMVGKCDSDLVAST